ncbi:hypothetical protein MTO96_018045 [Rhipicephalus appendiculatus]
MSQVMAHIDRVLGHLLDDLTTHTWLGLDDFNAFSQVRLSKAGAALAVCRFGMKSSGTQVAHRRRDLALRSVDVAAAPDGIWDNDALAFAAFLAGPGRIQ